MHQLVILGGGKQAHSRGGHVQRVIVHDYPMKEEDCVMKLQTVLKVLKPARELQKST